MRAFVPDLDRHLAACDLALVQGGLTTCMELAAAGTPFLYFPLQEPFRAERPRRPSPRQLRRRPPHGLHDGDPEAIAAAMLAELQRPTRFKPVEADGAARAARMLAELL